MYVYIYILLIDTKSLCICLVVYIWIEITFHDTLNFYLTLWLYVFWSEMTFS